MMSSAKFVAVVWGLAALLSSPRVAAQTSSEPDEPWVELTIDSDSLGERTLRIVTPRGYDDQTRSYPLLVLLDAQASAQFTSAISTVRFLAANNAIQPLIIVGIVTREDRARDLTPLGNEASRDWIPTGGGADNFLDFVTDEVVPMVRGRYRTLPFTILAGHSLGGLIGTYAAATRPDAFDAIIAMSPSLQYDGGAVVDEYARSIAARSVPLRLFTTSGAGEPIIDWSASRFADLMDSMPHPGVVYEHRRYPYAHGITPLFSLADGLLFVFRPLSLSGTALDRVPDPFNADSSRWVDAFKATESTYTHGAEHFPARDVGASETLPESFISRAARSALFSDEPGAAVLIARRGVELYPTSPRAHVTLGEAFAARRDTSSALSSLDVALELATAAEEGSLVDRITRRIEELKGEQ